MGGCLKFEEVHKIKNNYPDYSKIDIFIETGTHYGATIFNMVNHFRELHTIEIKNDIYMDTLNKSKSMGITSINFCLGDSAKILPSILDKIQGPAFFFLDGHFSHGNTGRGDSDTPLLDELRIINERHQKEAVILIDDFFMFGTKGNEDWTNITIGNVLNCFNKNRVLESYVDNDHFIILLKVI